VCSIQEEVAIPKTWILLDSQSTVDVFSNPSLLSNIHDTNKSLVLYCNAGKAIINKKGDLKGYATVWFYPSGIANTLSLSNVWKKCKVTYDSTLNEGFLVHKADSTTQVFRPSKKGLFFSDVQDNAGHVFVNTVAKNKSEYSDAVCTHSLHDIIGCPMTAEFIKYEENTMIPNCPVTKGDILCAEDIFGKDIG